MYGYSIFMNRDLNEQESMVSSIYIQEVLQLLIEQVFEQS